MCFVSLSEYTTIGCLSSIYVFVFESMYMVGTVSIHHFDLRSSLATMAREGDNKRAKAFS
jgi:hypothetical protein